MKLFYSFFIPLLLTIACLHGQNQDLVFLEGKRLPIKGDIIRSEDHSLSSNGKLFFVKNDKTKARYYRMDKIGTILTKEGKLYISPSKTQSFRDFSELEYGVIFLTNGNSIAISNWEIVGIDGEIEYLDFFTKELHTLSHGKFISIYDKQPDLQLFGDLELALSRLRTAALPQVPQTQDLEFDDAPGDNKVIARSDDELSVEEDSFESARQTGPDMPVDMEEFNQKAKLKVEKFASYVKTILEGEDRLRIRSVINQALILFISDTCYIEVSSLSRVKPTSYNIRRYFNRLNYLADKYTKIEITDGKVVKVSDIRKYKDNWYGTVTYGQRFSGYKDGMLIYSDYTQKNINIVLKVYEPEIEGESRAIWDVLLSNISVTETSQ